MASNKKHVIDLEDPATATKKAKEAPDPQQEQTPDEIMAILEEAGNVKAQLDKLEEEIEREKRKVDLRFLDKKKPLMRKRNDVLAKIQNFWAIVEYEDLDILQSMKDFWVEETEDTLKLIFVFNRNAYFENESIIKEYKLNTSNGAIEKITNSPIRWKPGKDITKKSQDCFFKWFSNTNTEDELGYVFYDYLWNDPLDTYMRALEEGSEEGEGAEGEEGDDEEGGGDE